MTDSIVILGLLSCVPVAFAYWYWRCLRKYANFPSYSLFWGLLHAFLKGRIPRNIPFTSFLLQELMSICQRFRKEGLCLMWFLEPYLFIYNEEAIKIFANEPAAIDHPSSYKSLEIAYGKGLITSNGERWKLHRKLMKPAFHVGIVKSKFPILNDNASMLVQKLRSTEGKPTKDINFFLQLCSFNALSESIVGYGINKDNTEKKTRHLMDLINKLAEFIAHKMVRPWYNWKLTMHLFPSVREHLKYCEELNDNFGEKVLNDMKEQVVSKQTSGSELAECDSEVFAKQPKSFTEILLDMHRKDPSFTMNNIKDEVYTFVTAGFDTVAHATMWSLFFLGLHPDVQQQAYHEVSSVAKNDITYNDLLKMPYLDSVIKETLRIHPTSPLFGRYLSKDIQCGKYLVPKGTNIIFFSYLWHRDPKLYPDPEKFDPNRFFEKDFEIKPWTHIPFAEGIRNCIGKHYAMAALKVFLAHILRSFEITTLDRRQDVVLKWQIVITSARPLNMQFTPRQPHVQSATVCG